MKNALSLLIALSMVCVGFATGCATSPKNGEEKANLDDEAQVALRELKRQDPTLDDVLSKAYGYVIFPSVGKGAFIAGAAYGRGEVFEQGKLIGYGDIRQGSIGLQAGGQAFSELIVFQTKEALYKFTNNNFTFGANASAVALKAGAGASAEFKDGVAVFVMPKAGAMLELSISGQKFYFVPLNEANENNPSTRPAAHRTETEVDVQRTR